MVGKTYTIKVTLTGGGEPTFNWNNFTYFVEQLKKEATENNIDVEVYLITNGVLSKKKLEYICENIDSIQISNERVLESSIL